MKAILKHMAGIVAALCCIVCSSCDSGYDCSLNNIAYNRIHFYTTNEYGIESAYKYPEALTVSMMVNGRDSIVVNHISNASELTLPVCYTSNCDTIVFNYASGITDTLYVGHDNIPFYQSMECGVIMHHSLTGAEHTGNYIDSMAINSTIVNFDNNENIKIYFVE